MLEKNSWTPLSPDQRNFFDHQLQGVLELAFGPTAQQAGIVALRANAFEVRINNLNTYKAMLWPDMTQNDACCGVFGLPRAGTERTYVSIIETPSSYVSEGVFIDAATGTYRGLYGEQVVQRHDLPEKSQSVAAIAMRFFAAGKKRSQEINTQGPGSLDQPQVVGIGSDKVSRLFTTLATFQGNMVASRTEVGERIATSATYDIAKALWRSSLHKAIQTDEEEGLILKADDGNVVGTLFEADGGMAIVRRTPNPEDAFAIATVSRPGVSDQSTFVEQHMVASGLSYLDVMALPAEACTDPKMVLAALPSIDENPRGDDHPDGQIIAALSPLEHPALQEKLTRLLLNRIQA